MPFRASLKRVLTRKSSSSSSSSSSASSSSPIESSRRDSSIFQPGEMPLPKYRRPVDPAHKAILDSFSFGPSQRRKSFSSQYSPMCSTLPSRRNSIEYFQPPTSFNEAPGIAQSIDGDSTDSESFSMLPTNTNSSIVSAQSSITDVSRESSIHENEAWTKEDLILALRRSNLIAPS